MYGVPTNANGVNRLARADRMSPASSSTLSKTVGTALVQATAIVVVAKLVDVLFESFMSRRRARQEQHLRREEPVGV